MSQRIDTFGFVESLRGTPISFRRRLATVVSVETGYSMTVRIAGDATSISGVRYFGHYPPKVGAQVWVDTDGADLICIGAIAGSGGAACAARVVKQAAQTLTTSGTAEKVTFAAGNANSFDPYGMYDAANDRFVAPFDGIYLLTGSVTYSANATGYRDVQFRKNGTQHSLNRLFSGITNDITLNHTVLITAVKTEYFEVWGNQTSGGSLQIVINGANQVGFGIQYVGPLS